MLKEDLKIEYHLPKSATRQALPTEWISMRRVGKLMPLLRYEKHGWGLRGFECFDAFITQLSNAFSKYQNVHRKKPKQQFIQKLDLNIYVQATF